MGTAFERLALIETYASFYSKGFAILFCQNLLLLNRTVGLYLINLGLAFLLQLRVYYFNGWLFTWQALRVVL